MVLAIASLPGRLDDVDDGFHRPDLHALQLSLAYFKSEVEEKSKKEREREKKKMAISDNWMSFIRVTGVRGL